MKFRLSVQNNKEITQPNSTKLIGKNHKKEFIYNSSESKIPGWMSAADISVNFQKTQSRQDHKDECSRTEEAASRTYSGEGCSGVRRT